MKRDNQKRVAYKPVVFLGLFAATVGIVLFVSDVVAEPSGLDSQILRLRDSISSGNFDVCDVRPAGCWIYVREIAQGLNADPEAGRTVLKLVGPDAKGAASAACKEMLARPGVFKEKITDEQSSLRQVILVGDKANALALIRKPSVDVNFYAENAFTPLLCSVSWGDMDVIRALVKRGVLTKPAGNQHLERAVLMALYDRRQGAFKKRLAVVKYLVDNGADVNAINSYGLTALDVAISDKSTAHYDTGGQAIPLSERVTLINTLLDGGANPNQVRPRNSMSTLSLAVWSQEIFQLLLDRGTDPGTSDETALQHAVIDGNVDAVRILTTRGVPANAIIPASYSKNPFNTSISNTPYTNRPVLVAAVSKRQTEIVKLLLQHGAKPDVCLQEGEGGKCKFGTYGTVLGQSVFDDLRYGSPGITEELLKHKANPNIQYEKGGTVFHYLLRHSPSIEVLRDDHGRIISNNDIPLNEEARARISIALMLLDHGADPNLKSAEPSSVIPEVKTPLMMTRMGDDLIIRKLLDMGGRIEPSDDDPAMRGIKAGPITWSLFHGRSDLIFALLDKDKKIHSSDRRVILYATNQAFPNEGPSRVSFRTTDELNKVVRRLLEAGAEVDLRGTQKQTALHDAVLSKNTELVRILLDARADVNARTMSLTEWSIKNPAKVAEMNMYKTMMQKNLESQRNKLTSEEKDQAEMMISGLTAEPYAYPAGGFTSLMLAVTSGSVEIVRLLVEGGAKVDIKSSSGRTALDIARMSENEQLIELLGKR